MKHVTEVDTSDSTEEDDLANWKSDIHKLVNDKLKPTPVDLNKLNDVVKYQLVKKNVFDGLVKKSNATQANDSNDLV